MEGVDLLKRVLPSVPDVREDGASVEGAPRVMGRRPVLHHYHAALE